MMTTNPGLTNRLRQHSRRAGVAVGVSMALTIVICLGGFVWVYAQVQPLIGDFVSVDAPVEEERALAGEPRARAPVPAADGGGGVAPTATVAPEPEPTPEPTPTPDAFRPDYQSSSAETIRFRAGPSTDTEILTALPPQTPLQYLGDDAPTANPAQDGDRWMRFRQEDGTEGWIREIDAEPYQP